MHGKTCQTFRGNSSQWGRLEQRKRNTLHSFDHWIIGTYILKNKLRLPQASRLSSLHPALGFIVLQCQNVTHSFCIVVWRVFWALLSWRKGTSTVYSRLAEIHYWWSTWNQTELYNKYIYIYIGFWNGLGPSQVRDGSTKLQGKWCLSKGLSSTGRKIEDEESILTYLHKVWQAAGSQHCQLRGSAVIVPWLSALRFEIRIPGKKQENS